MPLADIKGMQNPDAKAANLALINILHRAHIGKPFHALYDEKKYHEAHSFKWNNNTEKIFRVRQGDIRAYVFYLPNRVMLILKLSAKRKDKLSQAEKNELESLAIIALELQEQNQNQNESTLMVKNREQQKLTGRS